jgi:predicted small secreted protein
MSRTAVFRLVGDEGRLHCAQEHQAHETLSKGTSMSKMRRIWICLATLLTIACLAAGCNTIHGAGKDIEAGGEAIQKASD